MAMCKHDVDIAVCDYCNGDRPPGALTPATTTVQDGPFVWMQGAKLFHLPGCSEVLWDPNQAKDPAPRHNLTSAQVRDMLSSGTLTRGCRKCGANAGTPRS